MIVTVTPNPSIDRTIRIEHLERGALHRATSATAEAAGKGVNVSRALRVEGHDTLAIVPLAEQTAAAYRALLDDAVELAGVAIRGGIRSNLTLVERDGTMTKVNEPGPPLRRVDVEALLTCAASTGGTWLVGCGSLPPEAPNDFYASLIRTARAGRRVAIDTSGDALRETVHGGPDLLKPNVDELEELLGHRIADLGDAVDAAQVIVARGVGALLVSLGADGALYADGSTVLHAEAPIDDAANTVGAGDALLAGFLAAGGGPDAIGPAVSWAVASVRSPGTWMPPVTDRDRAAVILHPTIDRSRALRR
jgi:1-phosphofructokinase